MPRWTLLKKNWPMTELSCWPLLYIIIPLFFKFLLFIVKQIKVMEQKKENKNEMKYVAS